MKRIGAIWLHGDPPFSIKYALNKNHLLSEGVDVELISFLNGHPDDLDELKVGRLYPAYLFFRNEVTQQFLYEIHIFDGDRRIVVSRKR